MKKIKSITRYVSTESGQEKGILTTYERRDENGNVLEEIYYYPDGAIEQKIIRTFNEKRQLVEEQQLTEASIPDQTSTYTYAASGKPATKTVRYRDQSVSISNYLYNEADNSVTVETKDDQGTIEEKVYQQVDQEGRVMAETRSDEMGKVVQDMAMSYDDHGRTISQKMALNGEPAVTKFFDYFFDDNGLLIEIEVFDASDKVLRADTIEYDDNKNRTKYVIEDFEEGFVMETHTAYDDQQRVIKEDRKRANGIMESTEFTFGDHGLVAEIELTGADGLRLDTLEYEFFETTT